MKKILLLICLALIITTPLFAEDVSGDDQFNLPLLSIYSTRNEAMGGLVGTNAEGYTSLFSNPAGLARKNTAELLRIAAGPHADLSPDLINASYDLDLSTLMGSPLDTLSPLLDYVSFDNGIGVMGTATAGASYFGIGAGVSHTADLMVTQHNEETPANVRFISESQVAAGYSHKLVLGDANLYVGADVKKIWQIFSDTDIAPEEISLYQDDLDAINALTATLGTGIGFDAGAIIESGPFVGSLQLNNLFGTTLSLQEGILEDAFTLEGNFLAAELHGYELFTSTPTSGKKTIPMSLVAGVGVNIEADTYLSLILAGEYEHVFYIVSSESPEQTFFTSLRLGAELDLLETLQVRAGINQGYITGGFGMNFVKFFNLLDVSFNATYYGTELGKYAGQAQSEALLVDLVFSL